MLVPKYRPIVKRQKPQKITIQQWDTIGLETLQASFECTDWDMFVTATESIDELTETVTGYVNFCVQSIIPAKTLKIFANNKPWVTPEIKTIINKKKGAFGRGDKAQLRTIQKDLKSAIRKGKWEYKQKIESHFTQNNMKKVWQGMRLMSGYANGSGKSCPLPNTSLDYANQLNSFYNRFDCHDFSNEIQILLNSAAPMNKAFLSLEEHEVRQEFSRTNPAKAAGPDGISPRVLKNCCSQLAYVFTHIFNWSFKLSYVPKAWKLSCIIPVPKKSIISCDNDLRPVALTSVVMKSMERFILKHLRPIISPSLDPLQFAYSAKRNTEDAILFLLEKLYAHLEKSSYGASARIMYYDFSSAFNTIQPTVLANKLFSMNVSPPLVMWILNYLTSRTQYVYLRASNTKSEVKISNTGAPQGTVLAPFLFTVYTSDIRSTSDNCYLIKFADDTALLGLIQKDNHDSYLKQVDLFVNYCKLNYLELNVTKTKELLVDFRLRQHEPDPVIINNDCVKRATEYKYLGVVMDNCLSWSQHVDYICKKLNPRIFCFRRMGKFQVSPVILKMFYDSVISSVWKYCVSCWGGNTKVADESRINGSIKQAGRVAKEELLQFEQCYNEIVETKLGRILKDSSHPLHDCFANAISARSGRMLLPYANTNRHKNSFVVQAMNIFNKRHSR